MPQKPVLLGGLGMAMLFLRAGREAKALRDIDTSFSIVALDAFHLQLAGRSYWEGFLGASAGPGGRFVFRPGWRTVYSSAVEAAFFRVELADGTTGWGEPNAPVGPEIVCRIADGLLLPILAGRSFEHPAALWDFLYDTQRGRGHFSGFYLDAIAGIELAVWDALARRARLPLAALLCEAPRQQIPVYLSGLRRASRAERIALAREWADGGLTGVKVFLDSDTAAGTAELAALQAGAPGIGRWMVDVLWSFSEVEPAAAAKRAYGELGAEWLECPLLPEDLAGHRALQVLPGAPIALGESFHTRFEATPWLEGRALDVFQPDVGRTGISDILRQMRLAEAHRIAVTPHMGGALDLFQAATLHVAAACAGARLCEYQAGLAGRLGAAIDSGWRYEAGAFRLPERPGLGVEVDLEALARFVVR
jgi:D-galactarolactone cycloisomerase